MRTPATFKEADFKRAVKCALDMNLPIVRTEVGRDGRIVLFHAHAGGGEIPGSELDRWLSTDAS